MNRLTELIDIDGMKIKVSKERPLSNQNIGEILHKLYALEDIEEEIGIDLITLFKTLKQMFVFHKENVKIELLGLHIKSNELYLYGFVEDTSQAVYLRLKDHKKTWFLKEDRSE